MAFGERPEDLGTNGKESGTEDVVSEFRITEQRDDNPQQSENTAGGDEAARVKRARADFTFRGGATRAAAFGKPATTPPTKIASVVAWRDTSRPRTTASGCRAARRR